MEYFNSKHMGGAINSAGMSQQDCVSIVYLFRYLEYEEFKEITFESTNDFTIRFCDKKEISVQVKINQFSIKFVSDLLKKHDHMDTKKYVYVGSGFDDEFRNLYSKILRYKNAMISNMDEQEIKQVIKSIDIECKKKKINFEVIKDVEFDIVDKINGVNIAQNAIYEWADNQRLYVDVKSIMYELVAIIALDLRENGGQLKKEEVINLIFNHKQRKITSMNIKSNNYNGDKKYIINEIEKDMRKNHNMFFQKLQLLKNYIEMDLVVEALNESEELFYNNSKYGVIFAWLLLLNKKFDNAISVCEKSNKDNDFIHLLKARALMCMDKWTEAIETLNEARKVQDTYEINLELAKCYVNLGDKTKSLERFESCKTIDSERGEIYYEVGKLFSYTDECIYYMNAALERDRCLIKAYIEKGKALRYKGKFNEAIKCYEKYMEESKDFNNVFVLMELALSYYNANKAGTSFYIGKWIDRMIDFNTYQQLCLESKILICDIGYEYINYIVLNKKIDSIEILINDDIKQEMYYSDNSRIGIGLYASPSNTFLISFGNEDDQETLIEKASIPTIFKLFDSMDGFLKAKKRILEQDVLAINHDWEGYVEYIDKNNHVSAELFKKVNSVDVVVKIGDYMTNGSFVSVDKGFHAFTSKCQEEGSFNEAAIVLKSPEEDLQITFHKNNIKIHSILIL